MNKTAFALGVGLGLIGGAGLSAVIGAQAKPSMAQELIDLVPKISFRIYGRTTYIRQLADPQFSPGLEGSPNPANHDCCFVRMDDIDTVPEIDLDADIIFGMYYDPNNQINGAKNGWGPVPVIVCDTSYFGGYNKDVLFNGNVIHQYVSGQPFTATAWIHFNLLTGEVYHG